MAESTSKPALYGLMAEFDSAHTLYDAVLKAQKEGYDVMDAFTPMPVEAISEAIEHHKPSKVSLLVLIGGLTGASIAFFGQWWISAVDYPLNIGGRPLFSWPAFIPVTFELMVLLAAFSAVFGMFILNGLPQPYHPVFNVKNFERASQDRYFLVIESKDPKFDLQATRDFLAGVGSQEVHDVDW